MVLPSVPVTLSRSVSSSSIRIAASYNLASPEIDGPELSSAAFATGSARTTSETG